MGSPRRAQLLRSDYQHAETAGNCFWPLATHCRRELRRWQIGAARYWVDCDRSRADGRRHLPNNCGFRAQLDDREIAVASCGNEREMTLGVDCSAIGAFADRKPRNLPPVWRGHNRDGILAAGGNQLSRTSIIGNSSWSFASGERKARKDPARLRINDRHLILVLDVDVEVPVAISRG